MRWRILAPFAHTPALGWIPAHLSLKDHHLEVVPAGYAHDRSRSSTSARSWLDYFGHAARAWFRHKGADGFIIWFPQLAIGIGLCKRLTGSRKPVIAWCFNLGRAYPGLKGQLARFALRGVDVFVVHSRREIDTYARWLGLPRARFVFVPLSVEEPCVQPQRQDEPFVLAMGSAKRDYALLVKVMRDLGLPTLIVCGPHALEGIDLPDNVTFSSGMTIEACHALAMRARVNVVPIANDETASGQVTVIEAMMLGKPVIATRCLGTEDYLVDGVTGLLVAPRDEAALKEAILKLWNRPDLRQQIGLSARQAALLHFTFAATAPHLAALMQQLEKTVGSGTVSVTGTSGRSL